MLHLNIQHLSQHQKQLYGLIFFVCLSAAMLGALTGLLRWFSSASNVQQSWKPSEVPVVPDSIAQFTVLTTKSHWYLDPAKVAAQAKVDEKKSLEGQPEAYKLLGIIEKAGKKQALFMAIETAVSGRKVLSLTTGDNLVGDWKIQSISTSKVSLIAEKEGAESQQKEILLYATNSK